MSDGFALFDADDHLVVHNTRFIELFPFLASLGDLQGLTFYALASVPGGEASRVGNPDLYVTERMFRHVRADGEPFDIPLQSGGWARVRERRIPDGGIVSVWTDISELKTTEQKLLHAIDGISEGFIQITPHETVALVNAAMTGLFGSFGVDIRIGEPFDDLMRRGLEAGMFVAGTDRDMLDAELRALRLTPEARLEMELRNGAHMLVSYRRLDDGCTVAIWTNVTPQKRRENELIAMREQLRQQAEALSEFARLVARQARGDLLTGLPNRFALEERIGQILAAEHEDDVWVGFLDIDRFKNVNEKVGHAAADGLLRDFALFLRSQLRGDDMLARVGGDSFALLLVGLDGEEVRRIAERLNAAIRAYPFTAAGHSFSLSISIGLARAGGGDESASSLLVSADTACLVAKEAGRDRVQIYDAGDPKVSDTHERLSWVERIQTALELDRFTLDLQAIVDRTGQVLGYEALIRLVDESGATYVPTHFLPAARRLGFMGRIDEWVCRRAISYADRLHQRGSSGYICMNVGARSLADPEFQGRLIELLDARPGIEPSIRIEITETDAIDGPDEISGFLTRLRERGVKVLLDDFGNGYNSFEALKQLPVDGIKIDWTVTRDLLVDPIDEALMKAAISIAQTLGLELVAEGVETQAQLGKLHALGVALYQGYHFHRPQPAETVLG